MSSSEWLQPGGMLPAEFCFPRSSACLQWKDQCAIVGETLSLRSISWLENWRLDDKNCDKSHGIFFNHLESSIFLLMASRMFSSSSRCLRPILPSGWSLSVRLTYSPISFSETYCVHRSLSVRLTYSLISFSETYIFTDLFQWDLHIHRSLSVRLTYSPISFQWDINIHWSLSVRLTYSLISFSETYIFTDLFSVRFTYSLISFQWDININWSLSVRLTYSLICFSETYIFTNLF